MTDILNLTVAEVPSEAVGALRTSALQAGVPCLTRIDLTAVRMGPAGLNTETVRALGLVPFCEPSNGRLKVASTLPIPRVAFSALWRLTGFTAEVYLVTDDIFATLCEVYGIDRGQPAATPAIAAAASAASGFWAGAPDAESFPPGTPRRRKMRWHQAAWSRLMSSRLAADAHADDHHLEEGA